MYFHTDNQRDVEWLAHVLLTAADHERSVRLDADSEGNLRVKIGEGMWTAPIAGTHDPYRDPEPVREDYLGPAAAFALADRPIPKGL